MSLGILVHGGNHLILSGPLPAPECARRLAAEFAMSLVSLGCGPRCEFAAWQIRTREFRENLQWAVRLNPAEPASPAVSTLLEELAARGVPIHCEPQSWEGVRCDSSRS